MADQSQTNILREYLVALGFKVDEQQSGKFDKSLTRWDKAATKLSKSLVGVAVTAQTMVTEFAFRMEKLYFASKLAESSADNLAALQFGGRNIGIADMTSQVERFASAIRANPGLIGLLNSLGVAVEGRDKADVLTDMVAQLKKMPFYIGQRYASMFGISPNDLLLMEQGLDQMKQAQELRRQTAKDLGINTDEAAVAAHDLMNEWRSVLMYVGLFKDALIIDMLPSMRELAGVTNQVLVSWIKILQEPRQKFVDDLKLGLGLDKAGGGVELSPEAKARLNGTTPQMERDIPYHAPEGNVGLGKSLEDFFKWRARRGAVQRGELPREGPPPGYSDEPGPKKKEGSSYLEPTPPVKDVYRAPEGNTGLAHLLEKYQLWRENRGRAQRGLPPLPEHAPARAETALPAAPAPSKGEGSSPALPAPQTAPQAPAQNDSRATPEREGLLRQMEVKYALPPGILDRIWAKESQRGRAMLSPKGAKGHFGFMDATAKQYGLVDPNDFAKSAVAASTYMADLMKKYAGDAKLAAAAYNWGPGNLDKLLMDATKKGVSREDLDGYVLGHVPKETRDYVNSVAGDGSASQAQVTINQENNYNVTEASNAHDTAREIGEEQRRTNADTVRQFKSRIQ